MVTFKKIYYSKKLQLIPFKIFPLVSISFPASFLLLLEVVLKSLLCLQWCFYSYVSILSGLKGLPFMVMLTLGQSQ